MTINLDWRKKNILKFEDSTIAKECQIKHLISVLLVWFSFIRICTLLKLIVRLIWIRVKPIDAFVCVDSFYNMLVYTCIDLYWSKKKMNVLNGFINKLLFFVIFGSLFASFAWLNEWRPTFATWQLN